MIQHRFVVMIVRKRYVSPYRKSRYLIIGSPSLKTESTFKKAIAERSETWPDATYFLREDSGKVFARIETKSGKVIKVYKQSPVTEETYPCWTYFKK